MPHKIDALTRAQYAEVCRIFDEALDLPTYERTAYVNQACDGDADLRANVLALFKHAALAKQQMFLARTMRVGASVGHETRLKAKQQLGNYQIVDQIAAGGMGAVYKAIRISDYRQIVAIKVIHAGANSESIARRFRNERQVLASMKHPHIAAVFDGGTLEDRSPYFVMEFVDGKSIVEHCNALRLPTEERLQLFLSVLEGVSHAHQRGVLHRDLKPGNILVSREGLVKLVDFGIAKVLAPDSELAETSETVTDGGMLTPQYASPEQISEDVLTTATDVYSLGVVLYELLTGRHPTPPAGKTIADMRRAVCEMAPRPASEVVLRAPPPASPGREGTDDPCAVREGTSARLHRRLKGDVDLILLTALCKDVDRRYSSCERFGEDIRRFLQGRPILARPPSVGHNLRKFVLRHRGATALGAVALLGLLVAMGGAFTTRLAVQSERQRAQQLLGLADELAWDATDSVQHLPGAIKPRRQMVVRGLEALGNLNSSDPEVKYALAKAYFRLGEVDGDPLEPSFSEAESATRDFTRCLQLANELTAADSRDARFRLMAIYARIKLMDLAANTGGMDGSQLDYGAILSELDVLPINAETSWSAQTCRVELMIRKALQQLRAGSTHEAFSTMEHIWEPLRRLSEGETKADFETMLRIGRVNGMVGHIYLRAADYPRAFAMTERALAIGERLSTGEHRLAIDELISAMHLQAANVFVSQSNYEGAAHHFGIARKMLLHLRQLDPLDMQVATLLAATLFGTAQNFENQEQWQDATEACAAAEELLDELDRDFAPERGRLETRCQVLLTRWRLNEALGKTAEALQGAEHAIEGCRKATKAFPQDLDIRLAATINAAAAAEFLWNHEDRALASSALAESKRLLQEGWDEPAKTQALSNVLTSVAIVESRMFDADGDCDAAMRALHDALASNRAVHKIQPHNVQTTHNLCRLLYKQVEFVGRVASNVDDEARNDQTIVDLLQEIRQILIANLESTSLSEQDRSFLNQRLVSAEQHLTERRRFAPAP